MCAPAQQSSHRAVTAFLRGCCGDADCSVDFQKTKCVVFGREDDVDKAVVFLRALTEGMCKQWVGAPPPLSMTVWVRVLAALLLPQHLRGVQRDALEQPPVFSTHWLLQMRRL